MPDFQQERDIEARQLVRRLQTIKALGYTKRRPVEKVECCITGAGRGPERAPAKGWKPFAIPGRWGGLDQTHWFRFTAQLPAEFRGEQVVALVRLPGATHAAGAGLAWESGEALAYVNGEPTAGIDRNHETIVLTRKARTGDQFEILLEAQSGPRIETYHIFQYADIAVFDPYVWEFYWDSQVVLDVVNALPEDYAPRYRLQALLTQALEMVDLQHQGDKAFYASLTKAQKLLRAGLKEFAASYGMGNITLTGHSHIDTAWLWPLRETRRKCGRTWATVLRLMEHYPEFHFSASQPALYEFVKQNYPTLYEQIKKRVKEGRWEPCGATWVEQDNQMPAGEALVRQFLYGNRFYEREFGMRSRTAWLPDAFGFPWSLPQIMRKAGVDRFHTIKIHWSEFTAFPYHLFYWQGIDGTRIFTSLPHVSYNGDPNPAELIKTWQRFAQKDKSDESIYSFGYGDGGGGPTPEMIEYGKRLANIVGVPKTRFGRTQDCLDRMAAATEDKGLPVYNDELYLEIHRGCQTTQARTKRNNRKCEVQLHNAEWTSAMAHLHGGRYDHSTLCDAWRIVLTNQFHDILPGSSITEVYNDTEKDYAQAKELIAKAHNETLATLIKQIDTRGPGRALVVFNPVSWVRSDIVEAAAHLPESDFHIVGANGHAVPHQGTHDKRLLFEAHDLPPLGYAVYHVVPGKAEAPPSGMLKASTRQMENDFVRVKLDSAGRFTSIYDKTEEREVLAPNARGNELQLFDDRPHANDAWDIDHNFEDIAWEPGKAETLEIIEEGPVRAVVRVVRRTDKSTFTQDITLHARRNRIDVQLHVDWHEEHTLLKVAFPVDVLSPRATYHIQYGAIERATHRNWLRDRARFEATAHHWADIAEGDYGVSLLNDCTYSYDVKDNMLRLSLLRAPTEPDPIADQGEHSFTYALYPHVGDWRAGTVQEGYELNRPCFVAEDDPVKGSLPKVHAFASVDADNVIVDAVKKAEDSDALIVRLYEAYGQRGEARITFGDKPRKIAECDLMEENDAALDLDGHNVTLYVTPFEIRTLKVTF
ncbi:MAG: alpha-mannosidase [Candidatus Hydrogenedentota bacterium]